MLNLLESFYASCHMVVSFFNSYDCWKAECSEFGRECNLTKTEYENCLKGTDANIFIPLWASACKNSGKILQNEVTLEVIKFYKKYGYEAIGMDGNPADYIGEQFRFLEYLSSLTLRNVDDYSKVINQFIQAFTIDTVQSMIMAVAKYDCSPSFTGILEDMKTILQSGGLELQLTSKDIMEFDSYSWEKQPEITIKEEKYICSAGINDCGGRCRINASVQEGCIINLDTDNAADENPQIRSCVRGKGYKKTFLSTDRLRYPMKRTGERGSGKFERISWEEAIDIIASETKRIREKYGAASRFVMNATGITALMRPQNMIRNLFALDGGYLGFHNSYSNACAGYVMPTIYGDNFNSNSMEDVLNTKLLILWGHNPAETIYGPHTNYYISQLHKKGVRIVVIDPRKSDSVIAYGDEWVGIRPSTDGALIDAMAYVILKEGLEDQKFMDTYCIGFDKKHMPEGIPEEENYSDYLFGKKDGVEKTPEWAELICGVPADTIERLAKEYALTKPACILPGLGIQRTGNGEQTYRGIAMLCCLTGNVGISGGSAGDNICPPMHKMPSIPEPTNPYSGTIPNFLWTKAIEHGTELKPVEDGLKGVERLESNIKMVVNLAGNTLINQHSNINDTIRILKDTSKCEFIVTSDIFMTSSARYSDLVLPATSVFEGNNITMPWVGDGNYFLYNAKMMEPIFECRFEYDWLKEVARKLELYEEFTCGHETVEDWLSDSYEEIRKFEGELPSYEKFKKRGGYQYKNNKIRIAFEKQIKDKIPFKTPSGKIEIFSKTLYDMNQHELIPGIPSYTPCVEGPADPLKNKYPLQLIGYHSKRRCHSIHDNNEWMEEVDPQGLWIHPEDARLRGISNGMMIDVFNGRGRVRIPAKVTTRITKGIVALSEGAWYSPDKEGTDLRGCINVLTHTTPTPLAKGNPQHTNLVEVAKSIVSV
ncbi:MULTISPECIES: DMSO/selenate family reductase complex A subunit [Clostridium]|uniref:DMSO/selenate family reductase complex A subunit n=1 Tax=Clostridium frigoriphilum TaxID=443253 RepID=A0ABU7URP5_9CLOT|nr:DMSO/selenate family reductase complex A subunit [Clostridium sp. DSM 17811]MBU3100631.1 molybdopterin-dependent oxidoreductase [Clostridium sp. DSM 17811]